MLCDLITQRGDNTNLPGTGGQHLVGDDATQQDDRVTRGDLQVDRPSGAFSDVLESFVCSCWPDTKGAEVGRPFDIHHASDDRQIADGKIAVNSKVMPSTSIVRPAARSSRLPVDARDPSQCVNDRIRSCKILLSGSTWRGFQPSIGVAPLARAVWFVHFHFDSLGVRLGGVGAEPEQIGRAGQSADQHAAALHKETLRQQSADRRQPSALGAFVVEPHGFPGPNAGGSVTVTASTS